MKSANIFLELYRRLSRFYERYLYKGLIYYYRSEFLDNAMNRAIHNARLSVFKASLKQCGENPSIYFPVKIEQPDYVILGADVSMASFVHIWGGGGVTIGDRVMIGTHTSISSLTHDYTKEDMYKTLISKEVIIDDDVWIGSNCVIMPGIHIFRGAVVGAGSVVTKDVPERAIVIGVPARIIRYRP